MGDKTPIEWSDATWPVVAGCEKVSRECKHCWAIRTSWRLSHNPAPAVRAAYEVTVKKVGSKLAWTGLMRPLPERLGWPLKWKRGRKIFVCSQSDLFHKDVPNDFIDEVFAVMARCPRHTFQLLTKRPERMAEYLGGDDLEDRITELWREGDPDRETWSLMLPLKNVHCGFSAGNQETFDERWTHMERVARAGWFVWVSLEPVLSLVDLRFPASSTRSPFFSGSYEQATFSRPLLRWVVAGGESGADADPTHPDVARSLRDQCAAANVPFLWKQWGEWSPLGPMNARTCAVDLRGRTAEGVIRENFPKDATSADGWQTMYRVGKKAAGRLLDGCEHNEFPS